MHTRKSIISRSMAAWQGDLKDPKDQQRLLPARGQGEPVNAARRTASLFQRAAAYCRDWRTARTCDKGHGRLEIREQVASTELNEFLADKWVGVAQVFRLVRTVTKKGQTSEEVVYGLTALYGFPSS